MDEKSSRLGCEAGVDGEDAWGGLCPCHGSAGVYQRRGRGLDPAASLLSFQRRGRERMGDIRLIMKTLKKRSLKNR